MKNEEIKKKKQKNVRFPEELIDALQKASHSLGRHDSELVRDIVEMALLKGGFLNKSKTLDYIEFLTEKTGLPTNSHSKPSSSEPSQSPPQKPPVYKKPKRFTGKGGR